MTSTMELLQKALTVKRAAHWCNDRVDLQQGIASRPDPLAQDGHAR